MSMLQFSMATYVVQILSLFFDCTIFCVQIYATSKTVENFGAVHFLFIISQLPKLMYNKGVGE